MGVRQTGINTWVESRSAYCEQGLIVEQEYGIAYYDAICREEFTRLDSIGVPFQEFSHGTWLGKAEYMAL